MDTETPARDRAASDRTAADSTPDRWSALFAEQHRSLVIAIAAGVFLYAVNVYLATTVLPSLVANLGGLNLYAWGTTLFVFASLVGSTSTPAILHRIDARSLYRYGGAILIVGTVICALAPSMPVFLAGRFVQGLGGGLLYSLSFSMIHIALPPSLWARSLGLLSAMFGIATIVGPAVGGIAGQLGVWRVAFWAFVPVALFFATVGARGLPAEREAIGGTRVPVLSITLLGGSVLVIAAASISADGAVNLAGVIVACLGLIAWLAWEKRSGGQLLPEDTFHRRSPLPRLYGAMFALVVASTVEVFIPYFAQHLQGLDVLLAGYLGAAMAAGWSAGSMSLNGVHRRRLLVLRGGPIFCVAGMALLLVAGPVHSSSPGIVIAIVAGLVLLGWGIGMAWPHLSGAVLTAAPNDTRGTAGASISTVQLIATACGSALAGLLTNLGGLSHASGIGDISDAARLLYLAFLFAPILALFLLAPRTEPEAVPSPAG